MIDLPLLREMPSLQSLNVGCSYIYTSSLEALLHVTNLVKLELKDCENVTTAGLVVLQQLGSLSHLDISSGMMLNQCEPCLHSLVCRGCPASLLFSAWPQALLST